MRSRALLSVALVATFAAALAHVACSGSSAGITQGTPDASTAVDAAQDVVQGNDAPAPLLDGAPGVDASPAPVSVTFTYAPQWSGVTAVTVLGGFGQATDWTQPFVTLTAGASGVFQGTAMLPPGQYLYVFKVTGDVAAATPATYSRYAVDPAVTAYAACPQASPTFSMTDSNPCSQVSVPQSAAAQTFHVRGTLLVDGAPAATWLVMIERDEASSHHYFANRLTTGSDGTFDLQAAPGTYQLQVLYPTYLSKTDADRDPLSLNALRRSVSAAFTIGASDVNVPSPELGYHDYPSFAPQGGDGGTLPTTFAFGDDAGTSARLDVYEGKTGEIGDPWYQSATTASGMATFDGGFSTKAATEPSVVSGERYFWGTEEADGAETDGGAGWTGQTMVFPISWP